ncbi:SCO7613 C-terminal domain-containing membrane protein [Nocardioides litoris]|uniref:SCO7613 C-terminal domain-containing membrane protein n=1 Tax=Nocardioides litoris TaxID=1926648 RepID=UPI0011206EBB|nr:hypothetical protein [Nocardioides litoris]
MFTYADPRACPSCRGPLLQPAPADHRCAACGVAVGHPLAAEVFAALRHTDAVVGRLRSATTAPRPAAPVLPQPVTAPARVPVQPVQPRQGVRGSSVPAVLLGVGALCLLVASVIFLAVAWSWLGLGGRTAVLVGLTGVAGAASVVLAGRGLRVAAEALAAVALGLLVLDVVGAVRAGWVTTGPAGSTVLTGLVLAAAGGGLALVAAGGRRLAVPQVVGVGGLATAALALPSVAGHPLVVPTVAVVALVALAAAARRVGDLLPTVVTAALGAAVTWGQLVVVGLVGLVEVDELGVAALAGSPSYVGLLGAAVLLLAPVVVVRAEVVRQLAVAAAGSAATLLLALPALDEGPTTVAATSVVAAALWTAAALVVPRRRVAAALVPGVLAALPGLAVAAALAGQALAAALDPTTGLRAAPADAVAGPWLVGPALLVLLGLVAAPLSRAGRLVVLRLVPAALVAATAVGLALGGSSVVLLVALVVAGAAAYAVDGLRRGDAAGVAQTGLAATVTVLALPVAAASTPLVLLPLLVLVAVATGLAVAGRAPGAAELGLLLLAPALAGLTWVLGDLAGLDAGRAVPVLVVLTAAALGRPRVELEVSAAVAGTVAVLTALPMAGAEQTSLSLHLTLAGALVGTHAVVHASRRRLAWVGSALVLAGLWVRLADLGVEVVEGYTLPAAGLLLLAGALRLRRDRSASTALALAPGLLLATVPSLLHVLATDPVSPRALLLGLACLVLVLGGASLRWSAPLLVGAAVGTVLVLAELAPYAAATPQWVVIALAGAVLVAVGTTWERRVVDVQRAAHFVGRLR